MTTETITREAESFYCNALHALIDSGVPFMVGGAYAMREYADIYRDTKDLDVFCSVGEYTRLLGSLHDAGYKTEITNATWLAKAFQGDHPHDGGSMPFVDLIFGSANGRAPVDETWLEHARKIELLGCAVKLVPAEEQLWQKMLVQDRHRFDGADVMHILRKQGAQLEWKRLLQRMEPEWEVLLAHLMTFRYVYPAERDSVPRWLLDDLLGRVERELEMPSPIDRVCRGRTLSPTEYEIDVHDWGYRPN